MALNWTTAELGRLEPAFAKHHKNSGECARLARVVVAVSEGRGEANRVHKITERDGYLIVPREAIERKWFHHIVAETRAHGVDCFTGVSGVDWASYLSEKFYFSDALVCRLIDVMDPEQSQSQLE